MDLTVEGKLFVNGSFEKACIGIENGKIKSIKKVLKSENHIDFKNKLILPAGIDIHVHFRDPGFTYKEDFRSGSLSALYGGISCVFDMPNTKPQTINTRSIIDKISSFKNKSFVDFGIYSGITNSNSNQISNLSRRCNGFKIYLGSSTNSLLLDRKNLREVLEKISETGKIVLFHAEDEDLLNKNKGVENNLTDHLKNRPSECEESAIQNIFEASKNLNVKVHICHLSSAEGLELMKNKPSNISFGVTPHHSLLAIEKISKNQPFYKVNPPIRSIFDRDALFNSLKNNISDVIESDHAPHTIDEKSLDFESSPSGAPGVETMYPLFLYFAKKGFISFQRVISLICSRPAELVGISKGFLKKDFDADFIVVDLKKVERIKSSKLHSKCEWTPFESWSAIFPESVFIRGEKLIDEKEIQAKKGFGRFVGV